MKAGDLYCTAPLSILRSGTSALEAVSHAACCGIVNAGLGHRQVHGGPAFQALLREAHIHARAAGIATQCPPGVAIPLWEATLAGAKMLDLKAGNLHAVLQAYQQHVQSPRQVFFRMRADWVQNAWNHAANLAGNHTVPYDKPFTWREFRVIAALLSAKVNSYGFAFLGWESIQARACGYHTKTLLQAARDAGTLPAHCQPLTRDMIRHDLDKLEALGFFGRCRHSAGPRGGYTAYSFRHPQRPDLIAAVQSWSAANTSFKAKVATHRAEDLAAFRRNGQGDCGSGT